MQIPKKITAKLEFMAEIINRCKFLKLAPCILIFLYCHFILEWAKWPSVPKIRTQIVLSRNIIYPVTEAD